MTVRLTCITYNIHSGVGLDNRYDLGRIRQVLEREQAHVVALQEIECSADDQPAALAGGLGLASQYCPTRNAGTGTFGVSVLSAFPVLRHEQYDLSYAGAREPRFCQRVDLAVAPGATLHVFNCHLGLTVRERAFQRNRMLSDAVLLSEDLRHPVVLMGDFNDSPISVVHRRLRRHFTDAFTAAGTRWAPTFRLRSIPFRLDRIYCSRNIRVLDCRVPDDDSARIASDHRPVVATLEVTWPAAPIGHTRAPRE